MTNDKPTEVGSLYNLPKRKILGVAMDTNTLIMVGIAGILMLIAFFRRDGSLTSGLKTGGQTFLNLLPLLLSVFVIIGLANVLIPKELIATWMSDDSGLRGILVGTLLGALTPPSVFAAYPIGAVMRSSGAGVGPVVAYLAGWALLSVLRMPAEFGILGTKMALVRVASSLLLPPLAGLIASILSR
jgi:hypothetical protein